MLLLDSNPTEGKTSELTNVQLELLRVPQRLEQEKGERGGVTTKAYLKVRVQVLGLHKRLYLGCTREMSMLFILLSSKCR